MRRLVSQQALGFASVGEAVSHVARTKIAVFGLGVGWYAKWHQVVPHQGKQLFEGSAVAHGHVVDLVSGIFAGSRCQQVGLDGVLNEREVAAGFTVAVDEDCLAFEQGRYPFGNHGCISPIRVLTRAKDVKVAQAYGLKAIAAGKHAGIQLVDVFCHRVGAERVADVFFHLGQRGVVAIGAAAGGVGKALHFGVTGGHQHVQEAGDVGFVGGDGVGEAAGYAA